MDKRKNETNESEVNGQKRKIKKIMAQEGMPLSKEIKENIRKCLIGKSTTEFEGQKLSDTSDLI